MILLVIFALLSLVILPAAALGWLVRRSQSRLLWGLKATAVGAYVLATFYLGGWYMLSYYGRYVLLGLFALVALYGAWRMRHGIFWVRPEGWAWGELAGALLLLVLGGGALVGVHRAQQVPERSVDLAVPLRDGAFYVASGGGQSSMNPHMKVRDPALEKWRGQLWGLDVVQLYPLGNRAQGLYPTRPEQYAIFGTPVYAPCDGTVEKAVDQLPDLAPPSRDTTHKAGNFVMLRCSPDTYVLLAHLKQENVGVEAGDSVTTSTQLGTVGNSGNSWEPHLHMSAQRSMGTRTILDAEPKAMTFNGAFPLRNDVLRETPE